MVGLVAIVLATQLYVDIIVLRLYTPKRDPVPPAPTTVDTLVPEFSTTNLPTFSTTTEKEFITTTITPSTTTTKSSDPPCINVGTQECANRHLIGAGFDGGFLIGKLTPGR